MLPTARRVASICYSLIMFAAVSVLCGALVAGLFIPVAGLAGLAARTGAEQLENLPTDLATPPQSERSKVLMADGTVLANFYDENRVYVSLDKIAPIMRQAQISIEDHRFYEHGAIDLVGTLRAFLNNQTGGSAGGGGSSITQQYVKMVQVEAAQAKGDEDAVAAAQAPTYTRKIQELRYAIALEHKYTKDEILERYLNIAYYGDGAYGVEAAAHHYFNTTADKLSLAQAAMLAGIVKDPNNLNPVANLKAATDRRDTVLNRMAALGVISEAAATAAKKVRFDPKKVVGVPNGCQDTKFPFLCDYVRRSLLQDPALGKTEQDRKDLLNRGGLTIQTVIDPQLQSDTEKTIAKQVAPTDPVISVMSMVQPGTGLVLAMAQSRPEMGSKKGQTYWNFAVDRSLGGREGFQAGSTFKAFTAAAAFQKGIPMSKTYNAKSPLDLTGTSWQSCDGPFTLEKYVAHNSTGVNGVMDMVKGAKYSVNTYFLQLEEDAGLCNVVTMAKNLGVKIDSGGYSWDQYSHFPTFTLGTADVSPLSMAAAYATFAARGVYCDPHIVKTVVNKDGKSIKVDNGTCKQVIAPEVADAVNYVLSQVMTGSGAPAVVPGGYAQAGKTGTIEEHSAVWFAGYTPEVAGAGMVSIDNTMQPFKKDKYGHSKRQGLNGFVVGPKNNRHALIGSGGGDVGGPIYKPAMTEALQGKPKTAFVSPKSEYKTGKIIPIPDVSNMSPAEAKAALEKAGFTVSTMYVFSDAPAGQYLGTYPTGQAAKWSTIYLRYSKGPDPAAKSASASGDTSSTKPGGTDSSPPGHKPRKPR